MFLSVACAPSCPLAASWRLAAPVLAPLWMYPSGASPRYAACVARRARSTVGEPHSDFPLVAPPLPPPSPFSLRRASQRHPHQPLGAQAALCLRRRRTFPATRASSRTRRHVAVSCPPAPPPLPLHPCCAPLQEVAGRSYTRVVERALNKDAEQLAVGDMIPSAPHHTRKIAPTRCRPLSLSRNCCYKHARSTPDTHMWCLSRMACASVCVVCVLSVFLCMLVRVCCLQPLHNHHPCGQVPV